MPTAEEENCSFKSEILSSLMQRTLDSELKGQENSSIDSFVPLRYSRRLANWRTSYPCHLTWRCMMYVICIPY